MDLLLTKPFVSLVFFLLRQVKMSAVKNVYTFNGVQVGQTQQKGERDDRVHTHTVLRRGLIRKHEIKHLCVCAQD